ncbi:lysophospholipase catalytic domain-containing protein [Plectosphaerella plurivora]|uniref:Lysophospholipase n=1 Tax=Plectosphaerella plurivora TaxID=936078 RepID=A0A9P8V885_9PEZI|nr:lysophospholipase catalytic domain-containing protein [Plectosphaerella plurivora]
MLGPQILLTCWAASAALAAPGPGPVPAADPLPAVPDITSLDIRALPDSPSGGYAPQVVDCPSTRPSIRLANTLSSQETSWLPTRRNNTIDPLRALLTRANIPNFDAGSWIDRVRDNATALPNIAIAVSGGGYRALMNGAGFISAADSRNNESGPISGLLQSSTYLAGLSGGGWLVGSIFSNNFSTVPDLQAGSSDSAIWRFDRSIFRGPQESGIGILNTVQYWTEIGRAVASKALGWDTSITDFWGRALSYQLVNEPEGGPDYTFSSIADSQSFTDAETPFPILVADGRAPGERVVSLNATVYEFNPYELGSWDPTTYGFAPLRYLASNFTNGTIDSNGECVRGFDQIGFVMGTSSSLFNQFLLANVTAVGEEASIPTFVTNAIEGILDRLDQDENDIAQYAPNPFFGWNPNNNSVNSDQFQLSLVDGGEDLQNIPLHPLIQPFRAVDIIFAVDSSADTTFSWPNGTALRATYDRVGTSIGNNTLFPPVPDAETFINSGLNRRPTLFGCDPANFTLTAGQQVPPLIFYIPNAPYTAHSNVSTFDPSYPTDERDAIIRNGLNSATQGNGTVDEEWPVCVACAIMSRSWWKANETAPEACNACFQRYCWDGSLNDASVASYDPSFIIGADWEAEEDAAVTVRSVPWLMTAGVAVTLCMSLL